MESWTEIKSDDNSIPPGGAIEKYSNDFMKAAEMAGLTNVATQLECHLKTAGFVDVKVNILKFILGPWPKDPKQKVCEIY